MPTVTGLAEFHALVRRLPIELEEKVLPGAARAGAKVIAAEAARRCTSDLVSSAIAVRTREVEEGMRATVYVKGRWASSVAVWLEWGTAAHVIRADFEASGGRTAGRLNKEGGTLVINGKPIGATAFHPGTKPEPFMRVSLDVMQDDAVRAAQAYVNSKVTAAGIMGGDDGDGV